MLSETKLKAASNRHKPLLKGRFKSPEIFEFYRGMNLFREPHDDDCIAWPQCRAHNHYLRSFLVKHLTDACGSSFTKENVKNFLSHVPTCQVCPAEIKQLAYVRRPSQDVQSPLLATLVEEGLSKFRIIRSEQQRLVLIIDFVKKHTTEFSERSVKHAIWSLYGKAEMARRSSIPSADAASDSAGSQDNLGALRTSLTPEIMSTAPQNDRTTLPASSRVEVTTNTVQSGPGDAEPARGETTAPSGVTNLSRSRMANAAAVYFNDVTTSNQSFEDFKVDIGPGFFDAAYSKPETLANPVPPGTTNASISEMVDVGFTEVVDSTHSRMVTSEPAWLSKYTALNDAQRFSGDFQFGIGLGAANAGKAYPAYAQGHTGVSNVAPSGFDKPSAFKYALEPGDVQRNTYFGAMGAFSRLETNASLAQPGVVHARHPSIANEGQLEATSAAYPRITSAPPTNLNDSTATNDVQHFRKLQQGNGSEVIAIGTSSSRPDTAVNTLHPGTADSVQSGVPQAAQGSTSNATYSGRVYADVGHSAQPVASNNAQLLGDSRPLHSEIAGAAYLPAISAAHEEYTVTTSAKCAEPSEFHFAQLLGDFYGDTGVVCHNSSRDSNAHYGPPSLGSAWNPANSYAQAPIMEGPLFPFYPDLLHPPNHNRAAVPLQRPDVSVYACVPSRNGVPVPVANPVYAFATPFDWRQM